MARLLAQSYDKISLHAGTALKLAVDTTQETPEILRSLMIFGLEKAIAELVVGPQIQLAKVPRKAIVDDIAVVLSVFQSTAGKDMA